MFALEIAVICGLADLCCKLLCCSVLFTHSTSFFSLLRVLFSLASLDVFCVYVLLQSHSLTTSFLSCSFYSTVTVCGLRPNPTVTLARKLASWGCSCWGTTFPSPSFRSVSSLRLSFILYSRRRFAPP